MKRHIPIKANSIYYDKSTTSSVRELHHLTVYVWKEIVCKLVEEQLKHFSIEVL